MKIVEYITLTGETKRAKFFHKWTAKKLTYNSLFVEQLEAKLKAKCILSIKEAY